MKSIKTLLLVFALMSTSLLNAQEVLNVKITVSGSTRDMLIYAPKNMPENAPVVISMHGMNQDPTYQMEHTKWREIADTERFYVVFPHGEGNSWDIGGDKDVNFIKAVNRYMYSKYRINKGRVYASGFSMGGMMTYHLITKMADQIAAFAPVSGIPVDNRNPSGSRHVPLIHHHGSADDVVKFGGDPYHPAGGYRPITDYVTAWAKWNGCDMSSPEVKMVGADKRTTWKNEAEGIETVYTIIDGCGHWHSDNVWGGTYTTMEIWNFVKRYSLNGDFSYAPYLLRTVPSDGATGINQQSTFTFAFSEYIQVGPTTATAEYNGKVIALERVTSGETSRSIRFKFPEGVVLETGTYKISLNDVNSESGGHKDTFTISVGVEGNNTAISAISQEADAAQMYSLSGVKVSSSSKGVVVVKGNNGKTKKVLIK